LGLSVIGTGGLLLIAKKKHVIPSIYAGLSSLKHAGLFIAPKLEQMLLDIADEKKDT
jgi:predicted nucleic acid-binding protein